MSNSMSDDYFSFMSDRGQRKQATRRTVFPPAPDPIMQSDIIDFVEETQIEVTESSISDTMIQRIFRRLREE